ncbi:MAG: class I SAM-dependent methyltransferase [Clostridia bacterium]|jgi:ubiquinone/menaquinone biosynthesis C-methylase UbiE
MKKITEKNINTPQFFDNFFNQQFERDDEVRFKEMMKPLEIEGLKPVNLIQKDIKIIELGCGIARLLPRIKANFPEAEVHGLDYSTVAINRMKNLHRSIEYIKGDFLNTPYRDGYFDYVLNGDSIEHLEDPGLLIAEMARICKSGGKLIISTPDKETEVRGTPTPEHLWEFEESDMTRLMGRFGAVETKVIKSHWQTIIAICTVQK